MTRKTSEDSYDVIIIGAGLGGLVCGCYLAKAGMKVLICEQHSRPGGYCTSFTRHGFHFDAAAHSFGGYRPGGIVRKVAEDLELSGRLAVQRFDPVDVVCFGDRRISFWADTERTIDDIGRAFPGSEQQLRGFFTCITRGLSGKWAEMRRWTFGQLLDLHIQDFRLKAMLSFPLYGDAGLPPCRMSAFIGARIFHEFLLDGGYYPEGGMQALPDALAARFVELGGSLLLSSRVSSIPVEGRIATGVVLSDGTRLSGREIISNADSRLTFIELLGPGAVPADFRESLEKLEPSLSLFVLYAGMKEAVPQLPPGTNIWHMNHADIELAYSTACRGDTANVGGYMIRAAPDARTVLGFFNIARCSDEHWAAHKREVMHAFIRRIETDSCPGFSERLSFCEAATPHTLQRYTANSAGAAYGWACSPDQIGDMRFRIPYFLDNLKLTGHWAMQGLGIPGVAYAGMETARSLLRRHRTEMRS